MGTWGISISSNDTFAEVYDSFFNYYNNNWEIDLIVKQLEKDYQGIIDIEQDSNNFWFALAKALWECKALDITIFNKVKEIINSENDLRIWKELETSEQDLKKRKTVLDKFLLQISNPKDKPKARKKIRKKVVPSVFEKGDCLVFKMENENYGGAIVYEAEKQGEYGYNFVAATSINKSIKPNLSDFDRANILTIWEEEKYGKIVHKLNNEVPIAYWFEAKSYKEFADKFERVGNLCVTKKFSHDFLGSFHVWVPWDVLLVLSQQTFQRINDCQKPKLKISTKSWRK
jgi:hypothetical protein